MLLHNQTTPVPGGSAVKTAWVYNSDATNSTFVTNFYTGITTVYPQVGSYMLKQLESAGSATYASYSNNLSTTWNQYTVEGWALCSRSGTDLYGVRLNIGSPASGNYAYVSIIPYHTTPLDVLVSFTIFQGGTQVWTSSSVIPGDDVILSNNWFYYTMVKASPSLRFFMINGVTIWTDTTTTLNETFTTTTGTALALGRATPFYPTTTTLWDMTRISNIARYSQNQTFTPPTTMFTNDANTWFLSSFENTWTPAPSPT